MIDDRRVLGDEELTGDGAMFHLHALCPIACTATRTQSAAMCGQALGNGEVGKQLVADELSAMPFRMRSHEQQPLDAVQDPKDGMTGSVLPEI